MYSMSLPVFRGPNYFITNNKRLMMKKRRRRNKKKKSLITATKNLKEDAVDIFIWDTD